MNYATIGTGWIVDRFLSALQQVEGNKCIAMYTREEGRARALAKKYNVDNIYTNLEAMLSNSQIDVIYIASPNNLHYEQAYQALQFEKHVICEKPFTSTLREAESLINYAIDKGLMLFEAITTIHLPNFKLVKKNLDRIGRIKLVQCNYSQYSSRYELLLNGETPNVFNPEFSGGALADINVYNLHFVTRLFGRPKAVNYIANKHANGIDTSGVVVMEYPEMIAECTGSKDTHGLSFILIQGEKGYIHVENGPNGCSKVYMHTREGEVRLDAQDNENILVYEVVEFNKILQTKNINRCYELLNHSRSVMRILEEARKDADITFKADKIPIGKRD
ncbi:oxidoreductase [Bacillus freudenreichii]|nr:oxidoreductase [Bacillus freudenreichii]